MFTALGWEESTIEHTCVGRVSRSQSCCSGLELQGHCFGMVYYGPLGCGRELTLGATDLSMRCLVGALLHQSWLTIHWTNLRQRWDNSVASPDELTGRSDYTASS